MGSAETTEQLRKRIADMEKRVRFLELLHATMKNIRRRVWSMKTPEDIIGVAEAFREELIVHEVPFNFCGINIVDDVKNPSEVYTYNFIEEKPWSIPAPPVSRDVILKIWRGGRIAYRRDIKTVDEYNERSTFDTILENQLRSVIDAPFSHGTIAVSCIEPNAYSGNDIFLLENMAEVLTESFKRSDDLKELEDNTKKLENEIIEHKKIEQAYRESEERYRLLTENAPVGIFSVDCDGNFTEVNKKFLEIMGFSSAEYLGNINLFTSERLMDEGISNDFRGVMENGDIAVYTRKYQTKHGKNIIARYTVAPIYEKNTITGVQAIIEDITEQKRLEEQIQIRQRMDSLGSLAGGIAHDFNNILTSIMGNIDLLQLDIDTFTESHQENIREAYVSCQRAAKLIRDFQTFTSRSLSETESVDLKSVAKDVFALLERTTDKLITKKINIPDKRYFIEANPAQLHQILLNLGTNAIQSIGKKGVAAGDFIAISASEYNITQSDHTRLAPGEYIHIMFSDTGAGMTEDVKRHAFEPLFTTKERGIQKGQGLGLAMVYVMVTRNHNGYIDIETTPGFGTTFHIYLPKAEAPADQQSDETGADGRDNGTILVVEDENSLRIMVEKALKRYGFNVLSAGDGQDGIDIYNKNKEYIDMVLLDLTMPRMSGAMMIERLLEINPDVKIVIASGHSDEEIRKFTAAKGFLSKPYKLDELAATVRNVIEEH